MWYNSYTCLWRTGANHKTESKMESVLPSITTVRGVNNPLLSLPKRSKLERRVERVIDERSRFLEGELLEAVRVRNAGQPGEFGRGDRTYSSPFPNPNDVLRVPAIEKLIQENFSLKKVIGLGRFAAVLIVGDKHWNVIFISPTPGNPLAGEKEVRIFPGNPNMLSFISAQNPLAEMLIGANDHEVVEFSPDKRNFTTPYQVLKVYWTFTPSGRSCTAAPLKMAYQVILELVRLNWWPNSKQSCQLAKQL